MFKIKIDEEQEKLSDSIELSLDILKSYFTMKRSRFIIIEDVESGHFLQSTTDGVQHIIEFGDRKHVFRKVRKGGSGDQVYVDTPSGNIITPINQIFNVFEFENECRYFLEHSRVKMQNYEIHITL